MARVLAGFVKRPVARYLIAILSVLLATFIALPVYPGAVDFPVLLLRTPLTAIKTSISTLRNPGAPLSDGTALELLGTIEAEADRLVHFVSDALAMTRLEAGIAPDRQWNALGEIVSAVLDRVSPILGERPVTYDVPDTLPLA